MRYLKYAPLMTFFFLAFAFSWGIHLPMDITGTQITPIKLLAEYAPTLAALLVTAALTGKIGVKLLWKSIRKWRVNPLWYVLVLFGPAILEIIAITLFAGKGVQFHFPGWLFLPAVIIGLLLSFGEEIGWRGFAQPQLQKRLPWPLAALLIGTLWSLWHLPNGDITSLQQLTSLITYTAFAWFMISTISASVLMAWVYNQTNSILLIALFHFGLSWIGQFMTMTWQPGQFGPTQLTTVLQCIAAITLIILDHNKLYNKTIAADEISSGM